MKSLTIRTRLTLWYAAVVAVAMAVLGSGIYFAATLGVHRVADQELTAGANGIEAFLQHKLAIHQMDDLGEELREHASLIPRSRMFRVSDRNGVLIYQPDNMVFVPLQTPVQDETVIRNIAVQGRSIRTVSRYSHVGSYLFRLQVAVDQTEYKELLTGLAWLLVLSAPFAGLLAAAAGYWMSGRMLRPVQLITSTANSIDVNHLEKRLPISGTGDELDSLSATINSMLNRIATSYERIKQFTGDASHELRSPTAVVKASAELLLMGETDPEVVRRTLSNIVSEADYMTRIIADLLTLARTATDSGPQPEELFELEESIRALMPRITSLAQTKNIRAVISLDEDLLLLQGNQSVAERVLMILVDNAIRYTSSGGAVWVQLWRDHASGGFEVRDNGIGIPLEHQDKVFERFYRVDVARTPGDSGSGLGLSIAKSLTDLYGGEISLRSAPGQGSSFVVSFPRAVMPQSEGTTVAI
jgi:signal transduction histidine kinase